MLPGSTAAGAGALVLLVNLYVYFRCINEEGCTAYKFNGTEERNCVLINENLIEMSFLPSTEVHLYMKGLS